MRFLDGLQESKLDPVTLLLCPARDGDINKNGAACLGDLQDQMVPYREVERHVAVETAPSEGEIDECPFPLYMFVFFGSGRTGELSEL